MTKNEAIQRYTAALHAMQTGVAYEMQDNPAPTTPKQLRVGVNSAMVSNTALLRLLIEKGILTEEEYYVALALETETEVRRYEAALSFSRGVDIHLG